MKVRIRVALVIGFLAIGVAQAQDGPPSDASIHELLNVTHAQKMLDSMQGQMHGVMQQSIINSLGHAPDTQEQQILQRQEAKMEGLLKEQLTWSKYEPMFIDIYRKSFSQKEVDDLLTFYKSPSGQAVIAKMPVVMQQTMTYMQGTLKQILPQIQQIARETGEELQSYEARKSKEKPTSGAADKATKS